MAGKAATPGPARGITQVAALTLVFVTPPVIILIFLHVVPPELLLLHPENRGLGPLSHVAEAMQVVQFQVYDPSLEMAPSVVSGKDSHLSTQPSACPMGVLVFVYWTDDLINMESYMHMEIYIDIFQFKTSP